MDNAGSKQIGKDSILVRGKIQGAFSTQISTKIGMGTTAKKIIKKRYFYIEQIDDRYCVQELNVNYVPLEEKTFISKEEFLSTYTPEFEIYNEHVLPAIRQVRKKLARGDRFLNNKQAFSAEVEYNEALKVDEKNVRATFGLGFAYFFRNEKEKAKDIFSRLVQMEEPFQPEHKHLFNEFGIELRKNHMYEEAVAYYKRAVQMDSDDENLFFNIARAYYDMGNWRKCVAFLITCLELNRGVDEAQKFVRHLFKINEDEAACSRFGQTLAEKQVRNENSDLMQNLIKSAGITRKEADKIRQKVREKLEAQRLKQEKKQSGSSGSRKQEKIVLNL